MENILWLGRSDVPGRLNCTPLQSNPAGMSRRKIQSHLTISSHKLTRPWSLRYVSGHDAQVPRSKMSTMPRLFRSGSEPRTREQRRASRYRVLCGLRLSAQGLAVDRWAQASRQRLLWQNLQGVPVIDLSLIRNWSRRCRHRLAWIMIRNWGQSEQSNQSAPISAAGVALRAVSPPWPLAAQHVTDARQEGLPPLLFV